MLKSEIKLENIFPMDQFLLYGFKNPNRQDFCSKRCSILLFVSDNISSHLLNDYETPANIEYVFVEIFIKEKVWLLR